MQEQMPRSRKVRTTLQERFQVWYERERAEVRAEADGSLRRMLARQAERRFGAKAGVSVASLLAAIHDSDRFEEVGDWIVVCKASSDLLERLEGLVG